MNYFERLARRAMMRAADPGDSLHDPFEETSDWVLEQAAATLRPKEKAIDTTPVEASTHTREIVERLAPAPDLPATGESPPLPPPVEAHAAPIALVAAGPAAREPQAPGVAPPIAPAPEQAPAARALEAADSFMRTLGVRVPDLPLPPAEPIPDLAPPVSAMPTRGAATTAFQAQPLLQPPLTPVPDIPAPRRMESVAEHAMRRAPARESAPGPRASASSRVETQTVVVVEKRAIAGDAAATSGAGSPRFGLGQL